MIKVFKQYLKWRSAFFFLTEGMLILASVGMAIGLRFLFAEKRTFSEPSLFWKALVIAGVCQICFSYSDLYTFKNGKYMEALKRRLPQAIGTAALLLLVISYFFPSLLIGRGILILSLLICLFLVISWRYLYSSLLDRSVLTRKVMIIGSGYLAKEISHEILSNRTLGYKIIGVIDEGTDHSEGNALNPAMIGAYSQISEIVKKENIDQIIVAVKEQRGKLPVDELLSCKMSGVDVEEGITFYERMSGKVSLEELKPSWLIYSEGFKIKKYKLVIKRSMDIILSLIGLILSAPFLLMISFFIWLDSPGPIFYRQERVGENGKIFNLLKFRSMEVDAERGTGPVWAREKDPRVTRIGKLMRKTRIDEIPQLINVLKGEMSFVGPRPERPVFVDRLNREIPYYRLRGSIKPGVTGWAQVKYQYGASIKDAEEKLKYDLYYMKNLSLSLDLAIIISTIKVVCSGSGGR